MTNCSSSLDLDYIRQKVLLYNKIRSEYNDPTKSLIKDIQYDILNILNELHDTICSISGSGISGFQEGSILFASPTGEITEDNPNLHYTDASNLVTVGGNIVPKLDTSSSLGQVDKRFGDVFAEQTTIGAFFETGLRSEGIGELKTGTVVSWKDGKCVESTQSEDPLVMGIVKRGKDEPIILGAEYVLVTGKIEEGDYLVTSKVAGHCKGVKRGLLFKKDLFGKVIAQALESSNEKSKLIKAMIRKM